MHKRLGVTHMPQGWRTGGLGLQTCLAHVLRVQNRSERPYTNPVLAQNHLGKLTNQPETHLKTIFCRAG